MNMQARSPATLTSTGPATADLWTVLALCSVLVFAGLAFWSTHDLPFYSDSFNHLVVARSMESIWDCFDPGRTPFRPLQHLVFWVLQDHTTPAVGRLLLLGLHASAAFVTFVLARRFTGSAPAALLGLWLFLLVPNVKTIAWVAAIGWPGLLLGSLLAILAFEMHAERGGARSGMALLLSAAFALGFHQSAILLIPTLALLVLGRQGFAWRAPIREGLRLLRSPWVLATLAMLVAFVLFLALRENRYHGVNRLAAIPASLIKAALAFAPEALRVPAIDGLRGHSGTLGLAYGAAVLAVVAAAFLFLARQAGALTWTMLAITAVWLLFFAVTAGFVHRYAYGGSAYVALFLAIWWARRPSSLRLAFLLALAGFWVSDSWQDLREFERSGRLIERCITDSLSATREVPDGRRLVLVDAPYRLGTEEDIPVLQYGMESALRIAGLADWEIRTVRSRTYPFGTDFVLLSASDVSRAVAESDVALHYDEAADRYRRL